MVGKEVKVIVNGSAQAAAPQEQPAPSAPPAPPNADSKVNAVIDDRTGISFDKGIFHVTKRLEETFTPERLVEVFETMVVPRAEKINQDILEMEKAIVNAKGAHARAIRDMGAWLPNYERAKAMVGSKPLPATPSAIPLSDGPKPDAKPPEKVS